MYNTMAPVNNITFFQNREATLEQLKQLGVTKRVLIGLGSGDKSPAGIQKAFTILRENTEYLHEKGYEVCAWEWTWLDSCDRYGKLKSATGMVMESMVCPSDEAYVDFSCAYRAQMAATGVDMLLFDDDFSNFGFYNAPFSCCCDNHLRLISEKMGETVSFETLAEALLDGGANPYRSAWIAVNSDLQKNFARRIREAVDRVNPACRIGVCCSPAAWEFAADISEVSRILAGSTKPFLRLLGAPYWAVNKSYGGFRMQDVIEHERMVRSFCGENIEIVSEGDPYPRPRWSCPASFVENFDLAMRADGRFDGIFKYGIDYTAKPVYETGYADLCQYNEKAYAAIEQFFSGKEIKGVYVLESPRKYENMQIPERVKEGAPLEYMVFSQASKMLAANAIPTAYDNCGYGTVAFGENIKYAAPVDLNGGMILDIMAAKILTEQGVDVGLRSVGERVYPEREYFISEDTYVSIVHAYNETHWQGRTEAYRAEVDEKAQVQTRFVASDEELPGSYLYENADGQRFLVFLFDGFFCGETLFRMYARTRQLQQGIQWISGKELPAEYCGNPDTYLLCKQGSGKLAVGIWNFSADPILKPVIALDQPYNEITCFGCEGVLSGKTVRLSKLHAQEFACFEVG